jgi:hypothetical protein
LESETSLIWEIFWVSTSTCTIRSR